MATNVQRRVLASFVAVSTLLVIGAAYCLANDGAPAAKHDSETVVIKTAEDFKLLTEVKVSAAKRANSKGIIVASSVVVRGHAHGWTKGTDTLVTDFGTFYLQEMWPSGIVEELPRTTSTVEVKGTLHWYPGYAVPERDPSRAVQTNEHPGQRVPERFSLSDIEILDASEAGPVPIQASNVCDEVEIIGKLRVPLGKPRDLEGTWKSEPNEGKELAFIVDNLDGEDYFSNLPRISYVASEIKPAMAQAKMPAVKGERWKLRAYELGQVLGMPDEVKKELGEAAQDQPDLQFKTTLQIISCERIDAPPR